jgi:hypothetical protein
VKTTPKNIAIIWFKGAYSFFKSSGKNDVAEDMNSTYNDAEGIFKRVKESRP